MIIDADAHVVEGASFAKQALARWPERVKYQVGTDGKGDFTMEGRRYPEPEGPGAGCPPQHGLTDVPGSDPHTIEGMLRDADREGIERMVLYPSMGLAAPTLRDLRFGAEFSALYNSFIADWCKRSGGRLFGVAVVPIEDVQTSIRMMAEAKQQGLVCTLLPPALRERNLDHPDLESFYAAAADLDMPLGVHGAPGIHLPKIGVDRFTNYIQVHCVSFPFDMMVATTALVLVAHDYKYDLPVLRHALGTPVGYIGLLGSSRRGKAILDLLREDGLTEDSLGRVRVPIGLDLGAQTAPEIALAVLAEVLAVQRGATCLPISEKVRRGLK